MRASGWLQQITVDVTKIRLVASLERKIERFQSIPISLPIVRTLIPWRSCIHRLVILFLSFAVAGGAAEAKRPQAPGSSCTEAISAAAQANGVPNHLMAAIGLVEAGRQDPVNGIWRPWPWTINVLGKGLSFDSKSEAVATVQSLQAIGILSIDVGCMQVNLMQHPEAFATLDEALDPKHNANYAGRFLSQLVRQSGDWVIAAGWYHSTTADLAAEYVKRVLAILPGGKQGLVAERGVSTVMTTNGIRRPLLGRDGVIMPSVRQNASSLIPARPRDRAFSAKGNARLRFGG